MTTLLLFGVSLALLLYSLFRRPEWLLPALIALVWLSIGVMALLDRYNGAALWLGLI